MFPTFDPETKVWSGFEQPPLLNPEASLGQVLMALLKRTPTKVIQIDADTGLQMTCAEMQRRAVRAVQNMEAAGYRKGDMVAMVCTNSENLTPLVLAVLILGMPVNFLAPNYGLDDLIHMMKITQPKLVFCDADNLETVRKAIRQTGLPGAELYALECESPDVRKAEDLLRETGYEQMFFPPYLGDSRKTLAVVLCSSGTTGLAKGVCVSHAHLITLCGGLTMFRNCGLIFCFSPLFWGTGLYCLLFSITIGEPRLITRKPFSEDLFFDLMQQYPISNVFTQPAYAQMLLRHRRVNTIDWSNLESWSFGGSFVTEEVRDAIDALLPNGRSYITYGVSEIGASTVDLFGRKANSAGQVAPNISAKIVDEDGTALGIGEHGELLLRFSEPLLGYYNNPTATAEALCEGGWLRTGDIASFDEDGFLYMLDRKKDLLKYQGHQISPADLEAIIARIEGVEQVAVVGFPAEHGTYELAAAVIVKNPLSDLNEEKVLRIVDAQVADYKRLRGGVFFVSALPTTENGKILRRKLRDKLQARSKL
ncbi:probable 4-coumarate--CoA ligase 1 [Wyeomyia smithii]|uniref:probable 4-coumarate--CoA ligase 1 n=1 Tax=Wyeomyia smithii TaxID=174621 RepID=UPI0024681213|nr:probable 4-coumarate--CoA ligase 1 [Wyeomyia smithii]